MRVLGVLDGGDLPLELLSAWAASAELVIAADGAADRLLKSGVAPNIVIGDLDGFSGAPGPYEVVADHDGNSTDCDKLLRWVRQQGHTNLTLTGVEGDLLDHIVATLSSCVSYRRNVRLALRRGVGWVFSGAVTMRSAPGARVSLLPLCSCAGVRLSGVQWPLDGAQLDVGGHVSISNKASGEMVSARMNTGAAFLFVEYPRHEMPFWD